MNRCKAREIVRMRRTFLYAAVKHDERNTADGRFSTACQTRKTQKGGTQHGTGN